MGGYCYMKGSSNFLSNLARPNVTAMTVFALVCFLYLVGALEFLDFQIFDAQFRLNQRPASQTVVIVEVDSKSLKKLDVWPWPRSHFAKAVDKISAAGAKSVIVDFDFSSRSAEDARLQESFKNSKADIILPIFQQYLSLNVNGSKGQRIDTAPQADFLPYVEISSANYMAESDGLIRVQDIYHRYGHQDITTFAVAIADGISISYDSFFIDYGIQPDSIPRISFTDLIHNQFNATSLAGKNVIIGATALELGDIKSTPVYRTLAGPVLIAVSYEAIIQDRMLQLVPLVISLPLLLILCFLSTVLFMRFNWKIGSLSWLGLTLFFFVASSLTQDVSGWLFEISPMLIATILTFLFSVIRQTEMQSLRLLLQSVEIRRTNMLMRTVVENSFEGIVITDQDGLIIEANPSADAIFGYDPEQMIGKHLSGFFAKASLIKPTNLFPETLRKAFKTAELTGIRADGVEFDLETTLQPMKMQDEQNFAIFFRDITAQKEQARLLEHRARGQRLCAAARRPGTHRDAAQLIYPVEASLQPRNLYVGRLPERQRHPDLDAQLWRRDDNGRPQAVR